MTNLKYLEDTYLFESKAKVIGFGENELGKYILLDETIFYPQGGGQPCDIGEITFDKKIIKINNVRLSPEGEVYHYYEESSNLPILGENIILKIDKERRIQSAKNHSAGHLIDVAMKNIGLPELIPTKGYHFLDGCYVEYSGILSLDSSALIKKLNFELAQLISKNIKIIITNSGVSSEIKAPIGKTVRYVNFEGSDGCGCGGTHVNSSGEIGKIEIKKIKSKGNVVRISYAVFSE